LTNTLDISGSSAAETTFPIIVRISEVKMVRLNMFFSNSCNTWLYSYCLNAVDGDIFAAFRAGM